MSDERVGQLIWAFISSADDLNVAERAARKGRLGGIWLLPTLMTGPAETVAIVNRFQALSPCPLLVGVDAEAGLGLVMGGATLLPSAMALGAAGDSDLVRAAGAVTASEARACGINTVAAPVLDVNINPANPIVNTRAFGGSPELVARLGLAFAQGLQERNSAGNVVMAIGKHFPGHGDTVKDSHLELNVVDRPRDRLEAVELLPYRAAIEADIPMLMTAHVAYPALDRTPGLPATLSHAILTDLLRGTLGFRGAVVTDCMNMHAVARNFNPGDSTVKAVSAGCDLVLTDQWDAAYDALIAALHDGDLPESRVRQAADRISAVKVRLFGADLARPAPLDPELAMAAVGTPEHAAIADRIAAASVTLVRGDLPAPTKRPLILATRMARRFGPSVGAQLHAALEAAGWDTAQVQMVDPTPTGTQVSEAVEHAYMAGWVALLHFNRVSSFDPEAVLASDELAELARRVSATGVPLVVVSVGSPYVLSQFESATALLCSYSTCDASLRASLQVLKGAARPCGRLPVEIA